MEWVTDFCWDGTSFDSETAARHKAVSLNGESLVGTYYESCYNNFHSFVTDAYETEDGVEFGVHAKTGRVVWVHFDEREAFAENETLCPDWSEYDTEKPPQRVKELASQFINVEDYACDDPSVKDYTEDGQKLFSICEYTFAKKINGLKPTNYLTISMTSKGHLASIWIGEVDGPAADTLASMTRYTVDNVKAAVERDAKRMMRPLDVNPSFKYVNVCCAVTPEGDPVVVVAVVVKYTYNRGEAGSACVFVLDEMEV